MTIKSQQQKKEMIDYLLNNETAKNSDFAELLGVRSTRVKQILKELVDAEMVVAEGGNRNRSDRLK